MRKVKSKIKIVKNRIIELVFLTFEAFYYTLIIDEVHFKL